MEVSFDAHPGTYRHWRLSLEGDGAEKIAWLELAVDEQGGLYGGYELKLNSYDLGVDIELHDAVQRLRFEHPEVRAVVLTATDAKVFCAGANIRMLAAADHPTKVNFCRFTNETRCEIEDACETAGQTYLAALSGTASGGGYELALACERILLADDGSSAVSLPEVALLGVLPGTGGLTRLTDKRRVRRDVADAFVTRPEGARGKAALRAGLVDELLPRGRFTELVRERARAAAAASPAPPDAVGIPLPPLRRDGWTYSTVAAELDRAAGTVAITVTGPGDAADAAGRPDGGWPLRLARELDDLILRLRTNEPELGTWLLRTRGEIDAVLAADAWLSGGGWLPGEVAHALKRVFKRLDVTSRSLIALVEPGSCFAGPLLELVLAADRSYMLDETGTGVALGATNFGAFPTASGLTRLAARFLGEPDRVDKLRQHAGERLGAGAAVELELVTSAPDDLDYDDEVRLAVEARAALSPDALTAMEANLRFPGPETLETKIFGRLTAWQNWVFTRPNASGEQGALRSYGTGRRPVYDRKRA